MELDGIRLTKGDFWLWKVATQANTGVDLHSVFFVTEDNKFYEVVFTKPEEGQIANGWYLVERKVASKPEDDIPEAEVIEPSDENTLRIGVQEHSHVEAIFGGEHDKQDSES